MSNDLIAKFSEIKTKQKLKNAKVLFTYYSKLKKIQLKEKMKKWKKIATYELLRNPSLQFSKSLSKLHLQTSNNNGHHDASELLKSSGAISCCKLPIRETLEDKRHMDNVVNCTFSPKINNNYDISVLNRNPNTFDRLYTDHDNYLRKQNLRNQAKEEREAKGISFSPDMSLTSHKNLQSDGFHTRQAQYVHKKKAKAGRIRNDIDNSALSDCTFKPKINNKSMELPKEAYNSPGHVRLYNDALKRQKSSSSIKADKQSTKHVDYRRLEELYKDYKKTNYNKTKLRDTIDQEIGCTFRPHLNTNLPPSGLIERNHKMLEEKKNFIENYYKKDDEEERRMKRAGSSKMIGRLYEKGVEKMLHRNQVDERKKVELKNKTDNSKKFDKAFTFYGAKNTISPRIDNINKSNNSKVNSVNRNTKKKQNVDSKWLINNNNSNNNDGDALNLDTVVFNADEDDDDVRILKPVIKNKKSRIPSMDNNDKEIAKQSVAKNYSTKNLETGR
jgi:hypothetical protein